MAVRSRLLAAVFEPASGDTLWTTPAGRTAVVRLWEITNQAGAGVVCDVLYVSATLGGVYVRHQAAIAAHGTLPLNDWRVVNPGDSLRIDYSGSLLLSVLIFGSLLDGEPA